jgi:hypothetical protein
VFKELDIDMIGRGTVTAPNGKKCFMIASRFLPNYLDWTNNKKCQHEITFLLPDTAESKDFADSLPQNWGELVLAHPPFAAYYQGLHGQTMAQLAGRNLVLELKEKPDNLLDGLSFEKHRGLVKWREFTPSELDMREGIKPDKEEDTPTPKRPETKPIPAPVPVPADDKTAPLILPRQDESKPAPSSDDDIFSLCEKFFRKSIKWTRWIKRGAYIGITIGAGVGTRMGSKPAEMLLEGLGGAVLGAVLGGIAGALLHTVMMEKLARTKQDKQDKK